MFQVIMLILSVITTSLHGSNQNSFLAGDVSPSAPNNSNATPSNSNDTDDDSDDTGEVDEDIIIMDDEDTNDDEGVNN